MQMYAQLHINATFNEESRPQLCAAKLTQILGTKVDQALFQWLYYLIFTVLGDHALIYSAKNACKS